jgi:DNA excision repair protein ERCC-3
VVDGTLWTGRGLQEQAWQQYRKYLLRREGDDRIRIKKGAEFRLIAQMIEDGTLPFMPKPVEKDDLRTWDGIELRDYQQEAWDAFLKTGATGVFWAFGAGKSFYGLYALGRIKGQKLVIVPTLTLKEQWKERIRRHLAPFKDEIEIQTYHAYHKVRDNEYTLIEFDECQHLPANTFIRLATLRTKYRMGFSGSPYREDGRENYIIALTGFPVGMAWEHLIATHVVKKPVFRVYILRDEKEKFRKLDELLRLPQKTIIFCDWIPLGKRISRRFGIPFIYGETKNRLDLIRESQVCVVSRVGEEGLSVAELERVIEFAGLYGSRMQESQRFGRLMHALKEEPEHIILFTEKEYEAYQKRLYAITERGFRIQYIR